jgi:hypothetical protein
LKNCGNIKSETLNKLLGNGALVKITKPHILPHWNYFLCLEEDVFKLSKWIEFSEDNFSCYSLEIAKLLMTVSSEVDVIAKLVCKSINQNSTAESINKYQEEISEKFPTISKGHTSIPRHGIELTPWESWKNPKSPPDWWTATNKVKHHRSEHFKKATLINLLNAMSALLIMLTLYYRKEVNRMHPLSNLFIPKAFLLNMGENNVMFTDHA